MLKFGAPNLAIVLDDSIWRGLLIGKGWSEEGFLWNSLILSLLFHIWRERFKFARMDFPHIYLTILREIVQISDRLLKWDYKSFLARLTLLKKLDRNSYKQTLSWLIMTWWLVMTCLSCWGLIICRLNSATCTDLGLMVHGRISSTLLANLVLSATRWARLIQAFGRQISKSLLETTISLDNVAK